MEHLPAFAVSVSSASSVMLVFLLQLDSLDLSNNSLAGTLPSTWSMFEKVGCIFTIEKADAFCQCFERGELADAA